MARQQEAGEDPGVNKPAATETTADEVSVYRASPEITVDGRSHPIAVVSIPATLGGFLAALGGLILLASLVTATLGSIGYQSGLAGLRDELTVSGSIAGIAVLFIAFFIGGWVAGRLGRHHGARHGLVTVLWMILLAAAFAGLAALFGARYDVFSELDLPQFFSSDLFTITSTISGVLALVAMLAGGYLGGRLGERSTRRDTAALIETRRGVSTRDGGILQRRRESGSL